MSDIFEFSWPIPSAGHRWQEMGSHLLLTPIQSENDVSYNPLQERTGLFREFANTDPTPDDILKFANEYGSLTPPVHLAGATQDSFGGFRDDWKFRSQQVLEPFELWKREIYEMYEAVTLWDLASNQDRRRLRTYISWSPEKDIVAYDGPLGKKLIAASRDTMLPSGLDGRFEKLTAGDVILPALVFVQQLVTDHLKGHVIVSVPIDYSCNRMMLALKPDSLLAAMWLQLALAIDGKKTYRRCDMCGGWMEVQSETTGSGAKAARKNQKYCSESCKVKACRHRKYKARDLFAAGKSLQYIAKEMKTPVQQIEKWVTKDTKDEVTKRRK